MAYVLVWLKQHRRYMFESETELKTCDCGNYPRLIMFYVKGVANLVNWFVKCDTCRIRTRRRNKPQKAIDEWNEHRGSLYDGYKPTDHKEDL